MASSAKILCVLLLCFSVSFLQSHARESQFFSKFTPYNTNTDANNAKETEIPTKDIEPRKQNEEPTFTPEVQNGYGLYGRNTNSNNPERTSTEEYNGGENSEYMFNNGLPYDGNNNDLGTKQNGLSDTSFQDAVNRYRYNHNNNYGYEAKQANFNGNNGNSNFNNYRFPVQKQGMSDTRFLENGKYFYDVNNEDLYRNRYQAATRRNNVYESVNSENKYNQEGNDDNLYKFNNFMDDNKESQEEYVP